LILSQEGRKEMVFMTSLFAARKVKMAASLIGLAILWATFAIAGVNEDLMGAVKKGDLHKVKQLIDQGAQVNAKDTAPAR
jgi:hypothetical protein